MLLRDILSMRHALSLKYVCPLSLWNEVGKGYFDLFVVTSKCLIQKLKTLHSELKKFLTLSIYD